MDESKIMNSYKYSKQTTLEEHFSKRKREIIQEYEKEIERLNAKIRKLTRQRDKAWREISDLENKKDGCFKCGDTYKLYECIKCGNFSCIDHLGMLDDYCYKCSRCYFCKEQTEKWCESCDEMVCSLHMENDDICKECKKEKGKE